MDVCNHFEKRPHIDFNGQHGIEQVCDINGDRECFCNGNQNHCSYKNDLFFEKPGYITKTFMVQVSYPAYLDNDPSQKINAHLIENSIKDNCAYELGMIVKETGVDVRV